MAGDAFSSGLFVLGVVSSLVDSGCFMSQQPFFLFSGPAFLFCVSHSQRGGTAFRDSSSAPCSTHGHTLKTIPVPARNGQLHSRRFPRRFSFGNFALDIARRPVSNVPSRFYCRCKNETSPLVPPAVFRFSPPVRCPVRHSLQGPVQDHHKGTCFNHSCPYQNLDHTAVDQAISGSLETSCQ